MPGGLLATGPIHIGMLGNDLHLFSENDRVDPKPSFMRILLLKRSKDVHAMIRIGGLLSTLPYALDINYCIRRYVLTTIQHIHFNLMVYGA